MGAKDDGSDWQEEEDGEVSEELICVDGERGELWEI
eukprot:CAMPEP_0181096780 /NCGR_PEP_ID=MMETSP1071-20121207/11214_1 /TAXON_ID=35127 /ORGANISM="Thalassiosira sp., Strain NH16" /LENGTH=35 /DNA_ID= /DNA_START= /DNA_END= /DNA_ORIENTATION=